MPTDITGQELEVGDFVLYYGLDMSLGVITKIEAKPLADSGYTITLNYATTSYAGRPQPFERLGTKHLWSLDNKIVKITADQAHNYRQDNQEYLRLLVEKRNKILTDA